MTKRPFHAHRNGGYRVLQRGQGMTEYIIIVALIAIAAIAVFTFFGGVVRNQMSGIAHELSGTSATGDIGKAKTNAQQAMTQAQKKKNMGSYESGQ